MKIANTTINVLTVFKKKATTTKRAHAIAGRNLFQTVFYFGLEWGIQALFLCSKFVPKQPSITYQLLHTVSVVRKMCQPCLLLRAIDPGLSCSRTSPSGNSAQAWNIKSPSKRLHRFHLQQLSFWDAYERHSQCRKVFLNRGNLPTAKLKIWQPLSFHLFPFHVL